jgi:type I restriction enzyme S subunit
MAWPHVRLGDLMLEAKPGFASGHDVDQGMFQFRMNNLTREGRLDLSKRRRVPPDTKKINTYLLRPGDILFNATNSPELVGKSAYIAALDEPAVFSNHFLRLRSRTNNLDPRFLSRWLQLEWQRGLFRSRARQWVNQATYGREALLDLLVPLPPIGEQRRIASVLDEVDGLRAKRQVSLAVIDALAESIFMEVASSNSEWPTQSIEALSAGRPNSIRTGPFGSQLLHSEFVDGGVAVLGIDNAVQDHFVWARPRFITHKKFDQLRRYQVYPGDVLITIMGTCGRCAIVPDDVPLAINTKHLCCISLDREKCQPEFLWSCIKYQPRVRRQLGATARGAVMPGLNAGLIKAVQIPVPPIEVQRSVVARMEQAQALRGSVRQSEAELDDLFSALQRRAFAGQL